jgi:hypothetical protein
VLTRIDRVQVATTDIEATASQWGRILGAEHDSDDVVAALAARRSKYRVGDGYVEFLAPDGAGAVADALASRNGAAHLFAAGAASGDVDEFVLRFVERGIKVAVEGGQAFLDPEATGNHGLRLVVSPDDDLPSVGAIDYLYEVTNLVRDAGAATAAYADAFGLHPTAFVPIESSQFGYSGNLTLFNAQRLHRFEVITPDDPDKTMGRFFSKFGESLYMCFAECSQLDTVAERCKERGVGYTASPDGVFVHPDALGGVMMGLSRPTFAWTWSGHPERVEQP